MELILLYWDNIDDAAGAAALKLERLRKLSIQLMKWLGSVAIGTAVLAMTIVEPTLGLGAATILFVLSFYHRVTTPRLGLLTV